MDKKFLISWLVLFVAWMVGSFIVHGALLSADYKALHGLFRTEDDAVCVANSTAHGLVAGL